MAFSVAALMLVVLMFALVGAIASARESLLTRLRSSTPRFKRWGGWVLLGVGAWFIVLAIWADYFATVFPV